MKAPSRRSTFWGYGLSVDKPGNFIKKPMSACTGREILSEVLGHLHIEVEASKILKTSICIPCMMPFTWGWFGQGGIQRRIAKLLWLLRYPGSEPDCATWAFPRQSKLTCGRRIKRLHQYPACGGWGSGGRDHTYRRQFKPMASSIRPPGSAETDQVSVDCVNPLRWPMRRPSRWRLL
jgi:hypothetical protein